MATLEEILGGAAGVINPVRRDASGSGRSGLDPFDPGSAALGPSDTGDITTPGGTYAITPQPFDQQNFPGLDVEGLLGGPPGASPAPFGGGGPDPFEQIKQVQDRAAQYAGQLDEQFQAQVNQLKDLYEFAETPAEKAQIQFLLGNLEAKQDASKKIINKVYKRAVKTGERISKKMGRSGREAGRRTGDIYREAAEDTANLLGQFKGAFDDPGYGLQSEPLGGGATDWVASLSAAAPREQQFVESMYGIGAQDVASATAALGPEAAAQQAELQRLTQSLGAEAQMQHAAQVADRINRERSQYAGQVGDLSAMYANRGFGLQDQSLDAGLQAAGIAGSQQSQFLDALNRTQARDVGRMDDYRAALGGARLSEAQAARDYELRSREGAGGDPLEAAIAQMLGGGGQVGPGQDITDPQSYYAPGVQQGVPGVEPTGRPAGGRRGFNPLSFLTPGDIF